MAKQTKAGGARLEVVQPDPNGPKATAAREPGDQTSAAEPLGARRKLETRFYDAELARLQIELVKLQEWIRHQGLKVAVIFEGRDAAGKGGTIKRITRASIRGRAASWR
jgi:polyphosphate kinase 2 (PPK2 family)